MYVFDVIFLMDIMFAILYKCVGWLESKRYYKPRKLWMILLDIVSTMPSEFIYYIIFDINSDELDLTYCILTLRSALRIYRLLLHSIKLRGTVVGISLLALSLTEFLTAYYVMMLMFTVLLSIIRETRPMTRNLLEIMSYLVYRTVGIGFNLINSPPDILYLLLLPFMSIIFLLYCFTISLSTCALLQSYRPKMMFANTLNVWLIKIKSHFKGHSKDVMIKTLNTYALSCWKKGEKFRTNFQYDKIITRTMSKEIKLDLCFNALKHSNLFRKLDTHVLRHISGLMSVTFLTPGELLYRKHKFHTSMIYIITGIVQLLSQEDGETPILSFSGGTVLGETMLFISHPCPCTVMCKTYCEIIILKKIDFFEITKCYPELYLMLLIEVKKRYLQAKLYVSIFNYQLKLRESKEKREVLTLKWFKSISNKLYQERHEEREIKRIKDRKHDEIFQHCLLVTYYLDQIILTEDVELNTQAVLYKKTFPFIFFPSTIVMWLWDQIIAIFALINATCFIFYVCVSDTILNIYGALTMIITLMWCLDVYIQLSTAVRTKDKFVNTISEIISIKLKSLTFWIDCVAAFPLDIMIVLIQGKLPVQSIHLYQFNRLLKSYRLCRLFSLRYVNNPKSIVKRIQLRYLMTVLLLCVNVSGIFYLQLCPHFICSDALDAFIITIETSISELYLKFIICFYLAAGIMNGVNLEQVPMRSADEILLFLQLTKLVIYIFYTAELSAVIALERGFEQKFCEMKQSTMDVSKIWKIQDFHVKRMMKYLEIYSIDKYLFYNEIDMSHQIPTDLYKINVRNIYKNVQDYLPILKYLPEDVLTKVCMKLRQTIIPPGEVVVYYGEVCSKMYIIEAGCCKTFYQGANLWKILGPGDAFCVYEACKRTPTMVHVITLTHCKVISLDYVNYINALAEHPYILRETRCIFDKRDKQAEIHEFTDTIEMDESKVAEKCPSFKYFGYHLSLDTPKGEDYFEPFKKNNLTFYLKYLLLRVTFHCNGKFCLYWEISRCAFALLSSLFAPMVILTSPYYKYNKYLLISLDITAYIDMYVRHHITYYNMRKIEVTHPLKTAIYYWKHAFVIDLLAVIPIDIIVPFILRMEPNSTLLTFMRLNRLLQYYRLFTFLKQKGRKSGNRIWVILIHLIWFVSMINIIASLLVIVNCKTDINYKASAKFTGYIECDRSSFLYPHEINSFDAPYTPLKIQCLALYFVTATLCGVPIEGFRLLTGEIYVQVVFLSLLSVIYMIYVTTTIVACSLLKNVELIKFQNLLYELVKFLNYRKIDVKLRKEVIEHFEYLWMKKRGKTEQSLIQFFHSALQEDVMYDMYGKILHQNSVFTNASKGFYKSILHYVTHRIYLNMGIIMRVNQCHNKIFFLIKGTIEVLGPDYSRLILLPVGSMFGALDNGKMRQTLTMVAKGHVEVLAIKNEDFHYILSQFIKQRDQYKQLTFIHTDYLLGTMQRKRSASVEVNLDMNSKKRRFCKNVKTPKFFRKVYHGKFVRLWKLFILTVVCFIGYMIELYQKNSYDISIYILITLYTFDVLFLINIYLNFHVAYYDEFGLGVIDSKVIGSRYKRKKFGFWFDIISTIPIDLIAFFFQDPYLRSRILTYARWNRVIRVIHVIRYVASVNRKLHINVLMMRSLYLLIWIIVILQLIMNIYFLIAVLDRSLDYYSLQQPTENRLNKYLEEIAVIVSITCGTKLKHFLPNGNIMLLSTTLLMIILRFLIILIMCELCTTMEVLTAHKYQYEADTYELRRSMTNDDLAVPLQERAWLYCKLIWISNRGNNFPPLLKQSPYYLKEGILNSMFGYHLNKHPVLKKCHTDFLRQLTAYLRTRIFVAGDYITFIGDIDSCMYFIQEGEVLAIEKETVSTQIVAKKLREGEMFGFNQGVYPRTGHKYTYKAETYCFILELKRDNWIHLLEFFPASKFVIHNAREYLKVKIDD